MIVLDSNIGYPENIQIYLSNEYVALIDADEFLHGDVVKFIKKRQVASISMPWSMNVVFQRSALISNEKRFFLFPRGKEIVRTELILKAHEHSSLLNNTELPRLDLKQGKNFPLMHYYCRGIEDICLKSSYGEKRWGNTKKFQNRLETILLIKFLLRKEPIVRDSVSIVPDFSLMESLVKKPDIIEIEEKLSTLQAILKRKKVGLASSVCKEYFNASGEGLPPRLIAKHLF